MIQNYKDPITMPQSSFPQNNLTNFIAFYLGWGACVGGAALGYQWECVPAVTLLVGWHLFGRATWGLVAAITLCSVIGIITDYALVAIGVFSFTDSWRGTGSGIVPALDQWAGTLAYPLWMAFLWPLFATTITGCLSWLKGRPILALTFGALGGPPAYLAGRSLDLITFPQNETLSLLIISLEWAVIVPLFYVIHARIERFTGHPLLKSQPSPPQTKL